jgi:cytochrome c oxidase subunit 2
VSIRGIPGYDPAALQDRPKAFRRRPIALALAAAAIALLALAPAASAGIFTPEHGGSPNADEIDRLYRIVLYVSIPIFLVVEGTLIWSLIKYRERRGGPEPAQIRGNTPLELSWTIGATLILVVLAAITFIYLGDIKNPAESGPGGLASGVQVASIDQPSPPPAGGETLDIAVNGQQYLWRYDYPGGVFDYYEMVVPTNTTVTLKITASDVQHSWWIPELGGKADAVPGHTNETWFKIAKPGVYKGQCAELCGDGHADMRARVRAVSPEEYEAYLDEREQGIKAAQTGLAEQRRQREEATDEGEQSGG